MKNIFALAILLGVTAAINLKNQGPAEEFAARRQELKEAGGKEE